MVDNQNQCWLIEVNTNPSLELSNQWLAKIIPRMLDDCFKLTIDRLFPKKSQGKEENEGRYHIDGYEDHVNMWEYLDMNNNNEVSSSISWFFVLLCYF